MVLDSPFSLLSLAAANNSPGIVGPGVSYSSLCGFIRSYDLKGGGVGKLVGGGKTSARLVPRSRMVRGQALARLAAYYRS